VRPETEAAIRAASIALKIADSRQGADRIHSKGGIDLVTATDVTCEDAIRDELLRAFPDYPVVGEERGGSPVSGKPYWLVDPICGTRPFASDVPMYCTNIALVEDHAVTAAVVGIGKTGELVFAEKGSGAWMQTSAGRRPVRASGGSHILWIDGKSEQAANAVRSLLLMNRWYIWLFSSTVMYAHLAAGRIAGIIDFQKRSSALYGSVHTTAGRFVAIEAGAIGNYLDTGEPWRLDTGPLLLAATQELHDELTTALSREPSPGKSLPTQ
jgi:myo-inositol-1(or 4)-monophosphatase